MGSKVDFSKQKPYETPLKKVLLSHFCDPDPAKTPNFDVRFWRIFVEKGLILSRYRKKTGFLFFLEKVRARQ